MAEKVPKCPVCTGIIKPDIVFFGEELPHRFFLHVTDFPTADLLFVVGTSLEVWANHEHRKRMRAGFLRQRGSGTRGKKEWSKQ